MKTAKIKSLVLNLLGHPSTPVSPVSLKSLKTLSIQKELKQREMLRQTDELRSVPRHLNSRNWEQFGAKDDLLRKKDTAKNFYLR